MIELGNLKIGNPKKGNPDFLKDLLLTEKDLALTKSELGINQNKQSLKELQDSVSDQAKNMLKGIKDEIGDNDITTPEGVMGALQNKAKSMLGDINQEVPELSDMSVNVGGKVMDLTKDFGIDTELPTLDPFEEEDMANDPDGVGLAKKLKQPIFGESETPVETEQEDVSESEKLEKKLLEEAKGLIEGLDMDTILEKLASMCPSLQQAIKGIQVSIETIKQNKRISPEEKQRRMEYLKYQRKQQINAWKESQKDMVKQTINTIKSEFSNIKFQVENMVALIPIIISQVNLPTFIGTGSPNPARTVADFLSYKHLLQSMAKPIESSCTRLLEACNKIHFNLPAQVLKTVESVSKISGMISEIPG